MSKLKDDCFAFSDGLMPLELALGELEKIIEPVVGIARVRLACARLGLVLCLPAVNSAVG